MANIRGRTAMPPIDLKKVMKEAKEGRVLDKIKPTGTVEEETNVEVSETLKAFREATAGESKIFEDTTDSEYWICICFQSRNQKEAFLKAVEWFEHGDKYLDGKWVAKKMGVEIPAASTRFIEEERANRLVKEIGVLSDPTKRVDARPLGDGKK